MSRVHWVERWERADEESARPKAAAERRACRSFGVLIPVLSLVWILASAGFVLGQADPADTREETEASVRKTGDKIGPGVRETLEAEGSVRVVVALETPASLKRPERSRFNDIRRDVESVQNAVIGVLNSADHSMRRRYRMTPAFAADIHSQAALDRLARHPLVVRIDLDEKVTVELAESVPLIRADSMHAHGYTGEGVVVGILDTGIDTDHPDLADDLIHEECFLTYGVCPDGSDRQSGPGAAEDNNGHGTHVAGTITSEGIVSSIGVAPDAQIVAIKILDAGGSGWASDIIAGLDWILVNRPDVDLINMSLGSGYHETECDLANAVTTGFSVAINALRAVGVTTFASSGNDYSDSVMGSPACVSGAISVGAIDDADNVAEFSNSNAYTDLLAPGVDILADVPGGTLGAKSGTSMASPHAVGCAALQLEAGRATTPGSLEAWLKDSGVPITDTRNGLTFPRVDCFAEPVFSSPGPANDNVANAINVGPLPFIGSGNTWYAGNEPSEAFASCSSDHGNSIWWIFTPPESRRYEINTNGSGINTGLSVWTGSGHPRDELACDDDGGLITASRLRFDATAGQEYFIRVIGMAGAEGSIALNVMVPTLPVNDDIAEAIAMDPLPSTAYGSNVDASREPSEEFATCAADAGTAVWWKFTASDNGPVYVSTEGSDFNTVLAIWTGSEHPLNEIACDDNAGLGTLAWLSFEATAGETYYIRVAGFGGAEGNIVLNATTIPVCMTQTEIPLAECEALEDFFDSTNEVGWINSDGWKTSNTPCAWYGVSCDEGHVNGLDLRINWLAGPIPESIGNLTEVTALEFSGLNTAHPLSSPGNFLQGSIPETIGNLSNLTYLNLEWNGLNGPIPESIGNLTTLEHLNLSVNAISGSIPESIGNLSSLRYFYLGSNAVSGTLPESIGNLSNLTYLLLQWNAIGGSIPESIGNVHSLMGLDLTHNELTGRIPESIGNLTNLTYLQLGANSLSGPIPPTLGALTQLTRLSLLMNQLSGTIPLPVAKVGAPLDYRCKLEENDPGLCVPNILPYQLVAIDGYVCGLPLNPSCEPIVHAESKVFLEGPYSNGTMQASPAFTDHCPSLQPYSQTVFDGTPLDYNSPDVVLSPPDSAMDWVLVGLRSGVGPESVVPSSIRTAFLRTNGSIVDTSGTILAFPGVAPGAYRLVVRHRNHASVMSSAALDFTDGIGSWDFTTAMTQAYTASGAPMKLLRDGRFGMFACDANVDGQITAPDFNLWNAKTTAGATGYEQADCNLDGQVTAPDFNLWNANTTAGARSQVPD